MFRRKKTFNNIEITTEYWILITTVWLTMPEDILNFGQLSDTVPARLDFSGHSTSEEAVGQAIFMLIH